MKNKHMSFDDRLEIEKGLKERKTFKEIAKIINKNCTTISREIKNHYVTEQSGAIGRNFNNCLNRKTCHNRTNNCIKNCPDFIKEDCKLLTKPPYVCNGCKNKVSCTLTKQLYKSEYSHKEYKENLKDTRCGTTYTEEQLNRSKYFKN